MNEDNRIDVEAIGRDFRELVEGPTPSITETIKNMTWGIGRRAFARISNLIRRYNPMSGPDKIPQGSWGGDLDPSTSQRRADFEANLVQQQKAIQQQVQAAAGRPVQVIESMPPPQGPDAANYAIPDTGQGDLIGSMGADQERAARDLAKARAASGEGPPVPEDVIPAPPPAGPKAVGHIPKSLRAQMAVEAMQAPQQPRQQPIGQMAAESQRVLAPQTIDVDASLSPQTSQSRLSALANKKRSRGFDIGQAISQIQATREAVEEGRLGIETLFDLVEVTAELQYAIAAHLKGN